MTEDENQAIAAEKASIEDATIDVVAELPFSLFEKPNNKTTLLLASSGQNNILDGRSRWYEYKFKDATFVSRVTIQTSGYSGYHEFEFEWRDEAGAERRTLGIPSNKGTLTFNVNDLCKRVAFKPPVAWFARPEIQSISVVGVQREDIRRVLDMLDNLDAHKDTIIEIADGAIARADARIAEAQKLQQERVSIVKDIAVSKSQLSRIKKSIDGLSDKRNELIAQNFAAEESLDSANQRLKSIRAEVEVNRSHLEANRAAIVDSEAQLRALRGNINLFPTEIVAFVDQVSKSAKQYFWLAVVPIAIIPIVFITLIMGAADLSTIFTHDPKLNINAVVLSRMPYVAISLAIITACYKIAKAFILEMVKINNQRLNLTKISIIAKDVSQAAEQGLNLTDEEIFRLRADFKMQLLRDHMKEYISKDFRIQLPNQIISALGLVKARGSAQEGASPAIEVAVNGDGASMKLGS